MGGCLNACCASEGGLRCHSVLTLCGFFYFTFMFAIFPRQQHYFEFEVPDSDGTRWACLFSALLFLLWFFVAITKIMKIEANQGSASRKNKISLSELKEVVKRSQRNGEDRMETEKLLIDQ